MDDQNLIEAVEAAALNAWTAPCQVMYDGWLLRITGGDSKRVNSVNVHARSSLPLDEKIMTCEGIYQRFGQPCLFRLPEPFASPALRQTLANAGYVEFDPTHVLGRAIPASEDLPDGVVLRALNLQDWLEVRSWVSGIPLIRLVYHAKVLEVILPEKVLMGLFVRGKPAACGMGVVEGNFLGYFSIYTHKTWRRRDYACAMMSALSEWGREKGAAYGYLQVEGDNLPALRLYEKLGFKRLYTYSYWKPAK